MYRKRSRKQDEALSRKLEAMRRGADRARMAREPHCMPILPEVRRVVTVTDYDAGEPVTHIFECRRSSRVDSYRVWVDGKPWRKCGWSGVLAAVRKTHQRLPGPRSGRWDGVGYSARDEEDARAAHEGAMC